MAVLGPGLFRVMLALMVVASHMSNLEIGRPAVFIFFILSGFWVMRMFCEKYHSNRTVLPFYLSRLLRIGLPFLAAFLIYWSVLLAQGTPLDPSLAKGLLLLGVASHHQDVLGISWSLDIELQFYLMIPVLYLLLFRTESPPPPPPHVARHGGSGRAGLVPSTSLRPVDLPVLSPDVPSRRPDLANTLGAPSSNRVDKRRGFPHLGRGTGSDAVHARLFPQERRCSAPV